ncbi:MAG: hypothetical protein L0Y62_02885 [Nitrospirae bacterium]|nr:hypothetical protein [Nitrospirota bacterium]
MAKEYLCFSCGVKYALPQLDDSDIEAKCPRCNSSNVLKLEGTNDMGFFGGG